jgi:flavin reductase (DIM6/NTAB) family NADH-FMN oxidoreductase RutF
MPKEGAQFTEHYASVMETLLSRGLLLGSYDTAGKANIMTIGWGVLGSIWGKPIWIVLVRPSRHTYSAIEHSRAFTVNVPGSDLAEACEICGCESGRNLDKFAACGLTARRALTVEAPVVMECPIVYECKVVHFNDILAPRLSGEILAGSYRDGDFHRAYWGEIIACNADREAAKMLR